MHLSQVKSHFWKWFQQHINDYDGFFDSSPKKMGYLLTELNMHLLAYCKYLEAIIGKDDLTGKMLLTITANGYSRCFARADKLVAKAPALNNWEIQALEGPRPVNYMLDMYPDVALDPNRLWFTPLKDDSGADDRQDLQVYSELYTRDALPVFAEMIRIVLTNILGERSAGLDIGVVKLANSSEAPRPEALLRLEELPEFLSRRNSHQMEVSATGELRQRR